MYNSDFQCTYYMYDPKLMKKKKINDNVENSDEIFEEYLDLAEEKYRTEFLHVFGSNVCDICNDFENSINKIVNELYMKIINIEPMIEILKKLAASFMSEDLEIGLMVGFSYDYFFLTHPCICDYLKNGVISDENLEFLEKSLKN